VGAGRTAAILAKAAQSLEMIEDAESSGEVAYFASQTPAYGGKPFVTRALCSRPSRHVTHYTGSPRL
jgi:hypothetical protein